MLHSLLGYILARSFPEEIIVLFIGCYFLNLKVPVKTLLQKGLALGLVVSLIRMLPISFGIHTIIGMACILFVLVELSKDSFINCIMAICKVILCLTLSEGIYIYLLTGLFNVPEKLLVYNYTITGAIYTLPSLGIFVLLAFLLEFCIRKIRKVGAIKRNG